MADSIQTLIDRGVVIPDPAQVYIAPEVELDWIASAAELHPGTRVTGAATSIGPNSIISGETPATVDNCQLGAGVELKGGFFQKAVFLNGANVGSGAHIRPGSILEEEASAAHTVGFKQTILFPFTVTGSLINFCDALLAGGTSRKHHSEIGSSYIHFNFTPRGDKATASLVGDVPRGVMLNQPPIFLGGQGGLVGPARIAYGSTIAAGGIQRGDVLEEGKLVQPAAGPSRPSQIEYNTKQFGCIHRVVLRNLDYIGQITALQTWVRSVRGPFMETDPFQKRAWEGLIRNLEMIHAERMKRLDDVTQRMEGSLELLRAESRDTSQAGEEQKHWISRWPRVKDQLSKLVQKAGNDRHGDSLVQTMKGIGDDYISAVQELTPGEKARGTEWLQSIVDSHTALWDSQDLSG